MYFWRVERLKEQLRDGPLSQQASFTYILASVLPCAIGTYAPSGLWSSTSPPTIVDWLTYAMMVVLVGAGTYAAYSANGGRSGSDFASRYFALGWVLFIRLVVLAVLPTVVLVFAASAIQQGTATPGKPAEWGFAFVGILFEIGYYWRMVFHLRQVAIADVGRHRA